MVETTVDLDALDNHEFIIKSEWDDGLRIIRKKLDKLKHDMNKEHRRVSDDLDQEMDKKLFLENHRVHGWCFRLTRTVCIQTYILVRRLRLTNSPGSWLYQRQEAISRVLHPEKRSFLHDIGVAESSTRV